MEQLFAPWRIEWVKKDPPPSDADACVFCELPTQTRDRENLILFRGTHCFVLLNNYPYNPGHLMVIPYRHEARPNDLQQAEMYEYAEVTQRMLAVLEETLDPEGFNVGSNIDHVAAGGSLGAHLHRHIVPRWQGDTNFMPIISETKIIVEGLADTYETLHAGLLEHEDTQAHDHGGVCLSE